MKRPVEEIIIIDDSDEDDATQDRDDDELELVLKISKQSYAREEQQRHKQGNTQMSTNQQASTSRDEQRPIQPAVESRAEMERARLERLKLRELSGDIGSSRARMKVGPAVKRPRVATLADLQMQDEAGSSSTALNPPNQSRMGLSVQSRVRPSPGVQRFWDGAIKRVQNSLVPDDEALSFADVLAKDQGLEMAIVGAFVLMPEWVASHFDPETPLLFVMSRSSAEAELTNDEIVNPGVLDSSIKPNTFRVVPDVFRTNGYNGSMHTKIIVLYYKTFLRIAIPTANAVDYDWSIVDNAIFIQDFPLRSEAHKISADPRANSSHTQFSQDFLEVLHYLNVPKRFVSPYKWYDFAASKKIRLVHTRQGTWRGWEETKNGGGMVGLARAVKSLNFSSGGRWEVECQGSSIGTYQTNGLVQFFAACEGVKPKTYFRQNQKTPSHLTQAKGPVKLRLKIVYPTMDEIKNTFGGIEHGGTIFCQKKQWLATGFPRHLFHKGVSKRSRIAAHTKTIVALHKPSLKFEKSAKSAVKYEGWVYVGSHNFTPAAWGRLEWSSAGSPQIVCRNYELGVIIPIEAASEEELEQRASELATYERPLEPYGPDDKPWMQECPDF